LGVIIRVARVIEYDRISENNRVIGGTGNGFSIVDGIRSALIWYYEFTHKLGIIVFKKGENGIRF